MGTVDCFGVGFSSSVPSSFPREREGGEVDEGVEEVWETSMRYCAAISLRTK